MDQQQHRRSLYKEHKEVLSPHQHNCRNRQLQLANRQQKRKDLYQSSRNISPCPTPHKPAEDKENYRKEPIEEERDCDTTTTIANKSRTAKLIITARDPEKIKKQEAFILRFLDWKDKKKAMVEKKKCDVNKEKPFVSAVNKNSGFGDKNKILPKAVVPAAKAASSNHSSFVPKGHSGFKPPPGLKHPEEMVKEKIKTRQSIYTVVPTPPKKTKPAKDFPIARKALPTSLHNHASNHSKKTPARNICDMPEQGRHAKAMTNAFKAKTPASGTKSTTNSASRPLNNPPKSLHKTGSVDKKQQPHITTATTSSSKPAYKPRPLKMPPPPTVPAIKPPRPATRKRQFETAAPKITINGAKLKSAATKKLSSQKQASRNSPKQPQKNARLTQTMKAKKPTKPSSGPTTTKLVSLMLGEADNNLVVDMLAQTPRDFSNSNHFEEFVTSTKVKNSNQTLDEIKSVSPIEHIGKRSSTSAKRNILKVDTEANHRNNTKADKIDKSESVEKQKPLTTSKSRFNFIRYSEINVTINDDNEEAVDEGEEKEKAKGEEPPCSPENPENLTLVQEKSLPLENTPTKQKESPDKDKPVNYLSPYVSVSRGKVSLNKEKDKRNSLYSASPLTGIEKLNTSEDKNHTLCTTPKSPQYSVEVRRTLEAVRYYRKQLQDEIDRLHKKCEEWDAYKEENKTLLQEASLDDMIDVAVGQTRLLTSKKFVQFRGLIDRCEAGATGIGNRIDDGSEATKFISSTDLEGFWSMLGLQVDNLEKRFANLERWKNNNWQDPDEVKPKAVKAKNLTKVKKKVVAPAARAKPNSALQQMLRKMQAEMRSKKNNNMLANTDDVILTPSKVRDRKYFSPAATVVGIPSTGRNSLLGRKNSQDSPNRRNSLMGRKNSQDSPNRRMSIGVGGGDGVRRNSHDSARRFTQTTGVHLPTKSPAPTPRRATLHESVMRANAEAQVAAFSSPKIQGRKSILKTPGSARTNLRNVIFSQKCRVKKFKFILNDGDDANANDPECNESLEEDMKQDVQESDEVEASGACGTYSLRNRKVRLRPSCEIVIPK